METGTTTANYTYRPDGLRNTKTADGVTTTQVWDGDNMVLDLTGDTITGKYLRGIGLIAADLGGTRSYYLYNAHGDVTGLTNTAGTLTQSYDYDAFGNEKTTSDESDTNPFHYCGEYLDAETGSYDLRARYYDPGGGRFLTEDTIRRDATKSLNLNLYTYCWNNPVLNTDPSGNWPTLKDVTRATARAVIGNPVNAYATPKGLFCDIFYAAGFFMDDLWYYRDCSYAKIKHLRWCKQRRCSRHNPYMNLEKHFVFQS